MPGYYNYKTETLNLHYKLYFSVNQNYKNTDL